ncbi:MAG: phosphopantetheine-binding protein [Bdellovibrionota bacterium]
MNEMQIKEKLIAVLKDIAPEVEESDVDDKINLQEQFDLDSVDVMNFIIKVQKRFNVEIPNKDFRSFLVINEATKYLRKLV